MKTDETRGSHWSKISRKYYVGVILFCQLLEIMQSLYINNFIVFDLWRFEQIDSVYLFQMYDIE